MHRSKQHPYVVRSPLSVAAEQRYRDSGAERLAVLKRPLPGLMTTFMQSIV